MIENRYKFLDSEPVSLGTVSQDELRLPQSERERRALKLFTDERGDLRKGVALVTGQTDKHLANRLNYVPPLDRLPIVLDRNKR